MEAQWAAFAVGAPFVVWLVAENVRTKRLRDPLTLGGAAATGGAAAVASVVAHDPQPLIGGLAGGAALFLIMLAIWFANPAALGYGTVKSTIMVGIMSGCVGVSPWVGCVIGFAVGIVAFGGFSYLRSRGAAPTGPALAVGLLGAVVAALL